MSEYKKRDYTVEELLSFISFGIKDGMKSLVGELKTLNIRLEEMRDLIHHQRNKEGEIPF